MKVKVARTRKVTEAVEDGYAVFNGGIDGGQWFTSYQIPGSEDEWFVDRYGYAYPYTRESLERSYGSGGFRKKSELSGIYVIDGKPYMGKDN
jgi:hypothetical protein